MADRQTATGRRSGELRLELELEARGEAPATSKPRAADELEHCPCCDRDLVYPIDWAPAGQLQWSVALRCPECEWRGGGVYSQTVVDRFDEVLDDGTQAVLDDLELLTKANMEEQIDTFVAALQADLVLPEDF